MIRRCFVNRSDEAITVPGAMSINGLLVVFLALLEARFALLVVVPYDEVRIVRPPFRNLLSGKRFALELSWCGGRFIARFALIRNIELFRRIDAEHQLRSMAPSPNPGAVIHKLLVWLSLPNAIVRSDVLQSHVHGSAIALTTKSAG